MEIITSFEVAKETSKILREQHKVSARPVRVYGAERGTDSWAVQIIEPSGQTRLWNEGDAYGI